MNLAKLRERSELSASVLAERAGVAASTIRRLEHGARGCSSELLRRIADVLAAELGQNVGAVLKTLTDPE